MSGGFGLPILNLQGALQKIGDTYTDAYDKSVQQNALSVLGQKLKVGDYAGAASTAFDAGDAATGLSLIKLGQSAQQSKDATTAFGGLAGLYGGSAGQGGPASPQAPVGPSFLSSDGAMGSYLATTRGKESGGNDAAQNPNSTATGRYQFTAQTWAGLARRHPELGLTANGRTDPDQQERAMQQFTHNNAEALSAAGAPITPGNLYVSHFLGEKGGPRFILGAMNEPDAPAAKFVDPSAVRANRSIFLNGDGTPKTAGEVYAERTNRFGGGAAQPTRSAAAPAVLPPGASGLNPDARPQRVASADASFMPTASPSAGASPAVPAAPFVLPQGGAGAGPVMQMPGAPASPDSDDDGTSAAVTPPTVAAPNRQQISAQAPQHLERAGLPPAAAVAVGNTAPGSQNRVGVLMRIAGMPGLNEGQSKVVGALLTNELDQTKLPDSVKQYMFARTPAGGGFEGSFADFQNKKGDEGEKVTAQLQARERYAVSQNLDPKDPGVQSWILGGKSAAGHVLKPGDILSGAGGKELARNTGNAASGMSDENADFLAERVLAGDTKALIGLGRGAQGGDNLSKVQGLVAQKARERGIDASDILHNSAVASGMGAQERSLGTQAGRMSAAATEAEGALHLARQASAAVPRGSFVPLNKLTQMIQAGTSDPSLKAFNAANTTLVNTFSRAISPTGVSTDAAKQHAYALLSTADGPDAYEAVLKQMQAEIDMAHKAPQRARGVLEQERQTAKGGGQGVPSPAPGPAGSLQPSPYHEGQTATNPQTGAKAVFQGGRWVPVAAPTGGLL